MSCIHADNHDSTLGEVDVRSEVIALTGDSVLDGRLLTVLERIPGIDSMDLE